MKFMGRHRRTTANGRSAARFTAALLALLVLGVMASSALADGDPLSALEAITGTSTSSDSSSASSTSSDTTGTSTDETTSAETTTAAPTTDETTTSVTTNSVTLTPSITTDKADYEPGSTVTLSGSGWGAGESVHLFVNDTIGQTWQYNTDVVADLSGEFTVTFQLPNTFISNYDVTATGAAGEKATTTFTDGNATSVSGIVTDSVTHLGISGATLTCGASNGCNSTISTTTGASGQYVFDNSTAKLSFATNGPVTLTLTVAKSGYATGTITLSNVNNGNTFPGQNIELVPSCTATAVVTQPIAQTVTYGSDATFIVAGSGSPSPTVQWQVSSDGTTFTNIAGATNASLTLTRPAVSLSGNKYRAVFTNTCGGTQTATSNAASLTVNQRPITVTAITNTKDFDRTTTAAAVPTITTGTLATGDTASFSEAYQTAAVGTGKTLVPSGSVLDGNGGHNYAVTFVNDTTGVVSQRSVTASISAATKVYDGTRGTSATCALNAQSGTVGVVAGEGLAVIACAASGALFDTATAGSGKTVTANVALTGTGAGNYSLTSGTASDISSVGHRLVTASITAANKVYNGTDAASVTSCSLEPAADEHGVVGSDAVGCTGSNGHFGTALAGTGKTVTADVALSGGDSANYQLTSASAATTADISKRNVTASITAAGKVYDGAKDTTASCALNAQSGDVGVVTGVLPAVIDCAASNALFDTAAAGSGKTVTANVGLTGTGAGNYHLTNSTDTDLADITPKPVTVSFQVLDKVWDGNTSATIKSSPVPSFVGIVGMDDVTLGTATASATFATMAVGSGKTVTGSGFTKSGTDAGNYLFASPQGTTTASILAWNAAGKGFYAPVGADAAHSVFTPSGMVTPTTKPGAMTWNTIKGGQTVPLKFNVFAGALEKTGNDAFPSSDPKKAFQMQKLANCTDSLDADPVDFVASTGQTTLRYDTTGKQWIENWATPKVAATTCYRTYVTFADGSTLEAFFQLSK